MGKGKDKLRESSWNSLLLYLLRALLAVSFVDSCTAGKGLMGWQVQ